MTKTSTLELSLVSDDMNFGDFVAEQAGEGLGTPSSPFSNAQKVDNFAKEVKEGKVSNSAISEEFNSASTYSVGDIVSYNGKLWKCHTAISTAASWSGTTNWNETTIIDTLSGVSGSIVLSPENWNANIYSLTITGLGYYDAIMFSPSTSNDKSTLEKSNVFISSSASTVIFTAENVPTSGISLNYFVARGKSV